MRPALLKVCGLKDVETARSIASLAIDYIGFVFAPSRRQVTPHEAREMREAIRKQGGTMKFVGVFVNPKIEDLRALMDDVPLDVIQLHGQESEAFVRECRFLFSGVQIWKALGVRADADDAKDVSERLLPYHGIIDALLLDTYDPHVGGGTGKTFRWDLIPPFRVWTERQGIPLFIAGGLHAENVGELLRTYPLDGVDVSSGVETGGVKDYNKIRTFVKRVKSE